MQRSMISVEMSSNLIFVEFFLSLFFVYVICKIKISLLALDRFMVRERVVRHLALSHLRARNAQLQQHLANQAAQQQQQQQQAAQAVAAQQAGKQEEF